MARTTGRAGRVARARSTVSSSSRARVTIPSRKAMNAGRDSTRLAISTPASSSAVRMARGRFRPARAPRSRRGIPASAPPAGSNGAGSATDASDLEQLPLLVLEQGVDLGHVLVGDALEALLGPAQLVLGDVAVALQALQGVLLVPADVADAGPRLLGPVLGQAHVLLAPLLGELGEGQADDLAVVGRVDAQVGVADGLLDRGGGVAVVRRDDQQAGLGGGDAGQLLERGRGAVVVDLEAVDQGGVGAAGADAAELLLGHLDGLAHLALRLPERVLDHRCSPRCVSSASTASSFGPTTVPIGSPHTARRMLPSVSRSNTMMGRS